MGDRLIVEARGKITCATLTSTYRDNWIVHVSIGKRKVILVLDTIYAEGQRRYVESLSAYARQF